MSVLDPLLLPSLSFGSTDAPIAPVEAASNSVTTTDTSSNARPAGEQRPIATGAQKRPFPTDPSTVPKSSQGGRSRLFIGNVPTDLTQDEFQVLFRKYGELIEYYINPSRGFGFVKLVSLSLVCQA
jgi:RNA recognition motif-containing protein